MSEPLQKINKELDNIIDKCSSSIKEQKESLEKFLEEDSHTYSEESMKVINNIHTLQSILSLLTNAQQVSKLFIEERNK